MLMVLFSFPLEFSFGKGTLHDTCDTNISMMAPFHEKFAHIFTVCSVSH